MEKPWHHIGFTCPECHKEVHITEVVANSTGDMLIYGRCKPCKNNLEFTTSIQRILSRCAEADFLAPYEAQMETVE